jgi:cell division protein FtsL
MKNLEKHITIENIVMIVLFAVALWCAISAVGALQKNYELLTRLREGEIKNQIAELKITNLKLQQAYYKTDEFMELQAKAKLNKAMPGEHLVILPHLPENKNIVESDSVTPTRELTNSQKWAQFLLGVTYD